MGAAGRVTDLVLALGESMRLEPSGSGCKYIVEGEAKVSIPLIGGKAEGVVVGLTEKLTAKEAEVLRGLVS